MFPHLWRVPLNIRHALLAGLAVPLSLASATLLAQSTNTAPMRPAPGAPAQSTHAVTNPAAPVPAVLYRSVFVDTPTGVEAEEVDWKKANAEVGQFKRGHIDLLKLEQPPAAGQPTGTAP